MGRKFLCNSLTGNGERNVGTWVKIPKDDSDSDMIEEASKCQKGDQDCGHPPMVQVVEFNRLEFMSI